MYTCILVVFLKNTNIGSKIKRSIVTDYAALRASRKIIMLLNINPLEIETYLLRYFLTYGLGQASEGRCLKIDSIYYT